ncbi:MAG: porphobilinogen synthase [Candidatus Dormibacteria bacterium]
MSFPTERPRRLRKSALHRELAAEHRLHPADFVAPLFVREDILKPVPLTLLAGHNQETLDSITDRVEALLSVGCTKILLFGIPAHKDATGSEAWNDGGIIQEATRRIRSRFGHDVLIITDCCLDEYTSHGHCGILTEDGDVDNDATLVSYAKAAVSQARAGADIIAPSGMMDGQVGAIREALDEHGFSNVGIMAYSAKYASCLYGPFREAADCAPQFGDRSGYQMQPANGIEALREARLDAEEGADIIMVKPALWYLDIISALAHESELPVAAYLVSGECAMIHDGGERGLFNEERAMVEAHLALKRAGATILISYYAGAMCEYLAATTHAAHIPQAVH